MDYTLFPLLVLGGFAAGFINTVAGGGSMITLPLLILVGLPANVANGTNRVAILIQNTAAVLGFRSKGVNPWRAGLWLCIPAGLGAAAGAGTAVQVDPETLEHIFGIVLIVLSGVILVDPRNMLTGAPSDDSGARPSLKAFIVFFIVGWWGGFAQVGVGFLFLAGLVICSDMNLVYANAVKLFVILIFTAVSFFIFLFNGQVEILPGLVMAAGNASGAWVASRLSVKKGAGWVRSLLVLFALLAALKMLGVLDFLWNLIAG